MRQQGGGAGNVKMHGDGTCLRLNLEVSHDFRPSLGVGEILALGHLHAGDDVSVHDDALHRDADVVLDDGNSDDEDVGVGRKVRGLANLEASGTVCQRNASLGISGADGAVLRAGLDCSTDLGSEHIIEDLEEYTYSSMVGSHVLALLFIVSQTKP